MWRRKVRSIYADIYVANSHRAKKLPIVNRPWRPRLIAWAGPTAFNRNRFYEPDKWYKARIQKPELFPQLKIIDPADYALSLEERSVQSGNFSSLLHEIVPVGERLDIGFRETRETSEMIVPSSSSKELERLSRTGKCIRWFFVLIDLCSVFIDVDSTSNDQLTMIDHYRVMEHLFMPGVFFRSVVQMNVDFVDGHSVYTGNVLCPEHAQTPPTISIPLKGNQDGQGLYTLLMVDLDGCGDGQNERVHWLCANWTHSPDEGGEEMVPYLQPLPFYGTGYHRIVFLLFRHKHRVDFSAFFKRPINFDERSIRTLQLYKQFEDQITPCSLRFCQMQWDESCAQTMHTQAIDQPMYEYEWNEPRKPTQREFPNKPQPFDLYLDQYRDPEEVEASFVKQRLRQSSPFQAPPPPPLYPDIFWREHRHTMPSWLHDRQVRINSRKGPAGALSSNEI